MELLSKFQNGVRQGFARLWNGIYAGVRNVRLLRGAALPRTGMLQREIHRTAAEPSSLARSGKQRAQSLFNWKCLGCAQMLVDIGLPRMSGYEVVHRIKAAHPLMAVVALSGYGRPKGQATGDRRRI